jgi:transposase
MVLEWLKAGEISRRKAAKELGIGYASLKRLLDT